MTTAQILIVTFNGATSIPLYYWVYLLFYPLASVVSPLLGILSFMICKAFFYRAAAYMNSLSLFTNLLVFFTL